MLSNRDGHQYENVSLLECDSLTADDDDEKKCVCELDACSNESASGDIARRRLIRAAVLSVVFMVIELTGGYLAGSLAIMSDAAHLVTDSLTFVIGAAGITWARNRPDSKMNFGYQRVEVFCAILSIAGIWVLTLFITYFALQRLIHHNSFEIQTDTMLVVSILGVLVNVVMAAILHGGSIFHHNHSHNNHDLLIHQEKRSSGDDEMKELPGESSKKTQSHCQSENINLQAAFLHVLGDFIQSVGVIIAAIAIKFYVSSGIPQAKIVDPLITLSFSVIVVCTTVKILKRSADILLEKVPSHISYEALLNDLEDIKDIQSVHELKVWSLSSNFHVLTAHLVIEDEKTSQTVLIEATNMLKSMYSINQVTLQIEKKSSKKSVEQLPGIC